MRECQGSVGLVLSTAMQQANTLRVYPFFGAPMRVRLLYSALPALVFTAVHAQSLPPGTTVGSASLAGGAQFDTDFDSGGNFRRAELAASGEILRQWTPQLAAGLTVRYQFDQWNFDQPKAFGGRAPWGDVQAPQLGASLIYAPAADWRIVIAPSIQWSYEDGASASDAQIYGAVAIATKVFSPTLTLGIGAAAYRELSETKVFPFIAVNWKINDQWRLSNPLPAGPAGGAGLELTYTPVEGWEFGGGGAYRSTAFRLNNDGPVPGGIGEATSIPLFLRISKDITPKTRLDFYALALVNGKLTLKSPGGDDIVSEDYKTAPALALSLRHRF